MTSEMITVEVVYALAEQQSLLSLEVDDGCSAVEAVRRSGITELHPEINLDDLKLGLFSKVCSNEQSLKAGDRVEIYRPLVADPKEIRKRRAAQLSTKGAAKKAASKQ